MGIDGRRLLALLWRGVRLMRTVKWLIRAVNKSREHECRTPIQEHFK